MNEINLYIDESGDLGKVGRYFLIAALEVSSDNKKTITRRAKKVIHKFKQAYGISSKTEIKGAQLGDKRRKELLTQILARGVKVRYIVLDVQETTMLLKKADDKNACYNYLIQLLVKKITEDYPNIRRINLELDNRSIKVGHRHALNQYLYNRLVVETFEDHAHRIEFSVNYFASDTNYLIEWADIISNSLFKKYNSNINTYYNIIKPYIIHESKFPSKNFGK